MRRRSSRMLQTVLCAVLLCTLPRAVDAVGPVRTAGRDSLQTEPPAGGLPETVQVPGGISAAATGKRYGAGELREPLGLAVDLYGSVYAADAMAGKVFRFSPGMTPIEFERPARDAAFYPIDLDVYGNFIYVLDYTGNRILRFDNRGAYLDVLLKFVQLGGMHPVSLTAGEGGRIVTTDIESHTLTVWSPLLDVELTTGEYGWTEGRFDRPMKADVLGNGRIAVVEAGNRRIQVFSPAGDFETIIEAPAGMEFDTPRSISADQEGNFFVADARGGKVCMIAEDGSLRLVIDSWEGESIEPAAVAVGWDDLLYVADLRSASILVYRLHWEP